MKWALLLSGIIELIGACLCYFAPHLVYDNGSPYLVKLYGLSALVLGIINLLLYVYYSETKLVKLIYLAMMFFHGAVAMMTYGSASAAISYPLGTTLTHLGVFVVFLFGYMNDVKPDNAFK